MRKRTTSRAKETIKEATTKATEAVKETVEKTTVLKFLIFIVPENDTTLIKLRQRCSKSAI